MHVQVTTLFNTHSYSPSLFNASIIVDCHGRMHNIAFFLFYCLPLKLSYDASEMLATKIHRSLWYPVFWILMPTQGN